MSFYNGKYHDPPKPINNYLTPTWPWQLTPSLFRRLGRGLGCRDDATNWDPTLNPPLHIRLPTPDETGMKILSTFAPSHLDIIVNCILIVLKTGVLGATWSTVPPPHRYFPPPDVIRLPSQHCLSTCKSMSSFPPQSYWHAIFLRKVIVTGLPLLLPPSQINYNSCRSESQYCARSRISLTRTWSISRPLHPWEVTSLQLSPGKSSAPSQIREIRLNDWAYFPSFCVSCHLPTNSIFTLTGNKMRS